MILYVIQASFYIYLPNELGSIIWTYFLLNCSNELLFMYTLVILYGTVYHACNYRQLELLIKGRATVNSRIQSNVTIEGDQRQKFNVTRKITHHHWKFNATVTTRGFYGTVNHVLFLMRFEFVPKNGIKWNKTSKYGIIPKTVTQRKKFKNCHRN